jgi:carboxypeptidase Q
MRLLVLAAASAALAAPAFAQPAAPAPEPVDTAAVSFIRAEALERGRVMDHALWMTDIAGARLTSGPELDAAQRWATGQFQQWGLTAAMVPWGTLGRGWQVERFAMMARVGTARGDGLVAEQAFVVQGAPKAWSPSTGRVSGEVVVLDPTSDADLDRLAGSLRGKIVLLGTPSEVDLGLEAIAERRDASELLGMANAPASTSSGNRTYSPEVIARARATQTRRNRLFAEGPLAVLEPSGTGGHGAIRSMGAQMAADPETAFNTRPQPWAEGAETVPQVVLLDEHANRIMRLVAAGQRVTLDLDLETDFLRARPEENVVAEIRGTDLAGEVVILGAHQDSWHSGSGATDNAAGSAVVMEAARVLKAYYDARGSGPRRTIRFALWSGEEQGLHGSRGYVGQNYATSAGYGAPVTAITPAQATVSAYYNLDNGSGRIRGIYAQNNPAAEPIFTAWLRAYDDSTAQTTTLQNTGGTDHLSFDAAGIPGFQFIQDPLAYFAQTWHTSMDVYDHLSPDDLRQASAVMAVFAHHTAERDAMMPRKPFAVASGTN